MKVPCYERITRLEIELAEERSNSAANRRASERVIADLHARLAAARVEIDGYRARHDTAPPMAQGRQDFPAALVEVVCECPEED